MTNLPNQGVLLGAAQYTLYALQKLPVTARDLKQALLAGGSPTTPDAQVNPFEPFIAERCSGRIRVKVRAVVE